MSATQRSSAQPLVPVTGATGNPDDSVQRALASIGTEHGGACYGTWDRPIV